jgi:hypothetical protein
MPEAIQPVQRTALTLRLNDLIKTREGHMLVQNQLPFCLGGAVYQGFNGNVHDVDIKLLSNEEVENLIDLDGTKSNIVFRRRQSEESRQLLKKRELADREQKKLSEENDRIQLMLGRQKLKELAESGELKPVTAETVSGQEFLDDVNTRMGRLETAIDALTEIVMKLDRGAGSDTTPSPSPQGQVASEPAPEPEKDDPAPQIGFFQCDYGDCGKVFSTEQQLRGHKAGAGHR